MLMSLRRHIESEMQNALIPSNKLSDSAVRIRMLLHMRGPMSVREIREVTGFSRNTIVHACRKLVAEDWVIAAPREDAKGRLMVPVLPNSVENTIADKLTIDRSNIALLGQWIMLCWLDFKIVSATYLDGARPEWLKNRKTTKRMEFDRLYTDSKVAFEFQGEQHYGTTVRFTNQAEFEQLQERDDLKAGLCARHKYTYVEVRAADLSSAGMDLKIPAHMPRRSSLPDSPLASKLGELSTSYKAYIIGTSNAHED
jgi:hypothetical protein